MSTDILIVGCGDLGVALGQQLVAAGHRVAGVRRSNTSLPSGMQLVQADVTQPSTLTGLASLEPSVLVYCVAADAQTDDSYRQHYVEGLRNALAALSPISSLRHVFFVSSTRVYGQQTNIPIDEWTPAQPKDFGGHRLLEAEALLAELACPATALRLSGIYGPGRTRLLRLAADPTTWPRDNNWTNRIHRDDAAAFIALLANHVLNGKAVAPCYIVTDNQPVPQHEVLRWLADQLDHAVADMVPPVSGGKRLDNAALRATGFKLRYPDYRAGYAHEIATMIETNSELP